jgi:hypothetical protein
MLDLVEARPPATDSRPPTHGAGLGAHYASFNLVAHMSTSGGLLDLVLEQTNFTGNAGLPRPVSELLDGVGRRRTHRLERGVAPAALLREHRMSETDTRRLLSR